jgi:hypothetical protein
MPHYERSQESAGVAGRSLMVSDPVGGGPDDEAIEDAAEALREVEIDAALPDLNSLDAPQLERMSIDELRAVGKALDVPGRAQITEQEELIEAIQRCL